LRVAVTLVVVCVAGVLVAACGGSATVGGGAAQLASEQAAPGCKQIEKPRPREKQHLSEPNVTVDQNKSYRAQVLTNCGEFTILLASKRAPKTVGSFVSLAQQGFYDGLTFHRVVNGFVVQGGDPQGSGVGGPGYAVVEKPPANLQYTRGIVAMAKTSAEKPGTSGSQFFIVTGEDAQLPPEYALLGKVISGMETIDRIETVRTNSQDQPLQPVVMRQVKILAE